MSSCSSLPYSRRLANQRESQVRLMPSLRPIGLTFWPIRRPPSTSRTMIVSWLKNFLDAPDPAAGARRPALHHQVLADISLGDHQLVDVEIMVVLGIGDRRFERLLDRAGDAPAREGELGQRLVDLLAADDGRDFVELARRHADRAGHRLGFVVGERPLVWLSCSCLAALSPLRRLLVGDAEWPWKIRVGANSPSL